MGIRTETGRNVVPRPGIAAISSSCNIKFNIAYLLSSLTLLTYFDNADVSGFCYRPGICYLCPRSETHLPHPMQRFSSWCYVPVYGLRFLAARRRWPQA